MTLRPKLQKLSNFELKFRNIPQTLAKILPNFISGPKMVRFYSKKCIFRWGLKRAPPGTQASKNMPGLIGLMIIIGNEFCIDKHFLVFP